MLPAVTPGTRPPRADAPSPQLLQRVLAGLRALPEATSVRTTAPVYWHLVRTEVGDREVYKHQVVVGQHRYTSTGTCDQVLDWLGPQLP